MHLLKKFQCLYANILHLLYLPSLIADDPVFTNLGL